MNVKNLIEEDTANEVPIFPLKPIHQFVEKTILSDPQLGKDQCSK